MFAQIVLSGIVIGCIYSLCGVGLIVLYRGTTIINFAQGEILMLGAYIAFALITFYHVNYLFALSVSVLLALLLGGVIFRTIFIRLIDAPHVNQVLGTVGLIYFLQGMVRFIWGSDINFLPPLISHQSLELLGLSTSSQEIVILVATSIFIVIFAWFFFSTRAGKMMQAASQSLRGASLIGINVINFHTSMWVLSAGIGAFAGILVAPLMSVSPEMGSSVLLKAFAAMTLGGFGSIPGVLIGGLLMGVIENLTAFYISSALREISAFSVIILILLFKPTGIMGVSAK